MPSGLDTLVGLLPKTLLGACTEVCTKAQTKEAKLEEEAQAPGQNQIFTFYKQLPQDKQCQLDGDFDSFTVEEFEEAWASADERNDLLHQAIDTSPPRVLNWELKKPPEPGPGANLTKLVDVGEKKQLMWRSSGLELYSRNRVAIVIMSGGRDQHLGNSMPKGVLDIGLLSGKSIFQLYMERIIRLQHLVQRKFNRTIHVPIYVMCNSENRSIIEDFFHENAFFGVREQDILFFTQGNYPVCNKHGKIILSEMHRIAQEPNGNGGLFPALVEEGMLSDMKSHGVTSIFISSIDNVLAKVGDPLFLGYCETCKAEAGLKTVQKITPDERFGVYLSKTYKRMSEDLDGDGKLDTVSKVKASVVESFEMPEDMRRRRVKLSSGATPLQLSSANMSQYFFKVDFIKRFFAQQSKRWHAIPTSVSYVDVATGQRVPAPTGGQTNAFRMEMFIFDALESPKSVVGFEVERSEFANVKTLTGPESPQAALVAMGRLHQLWITAAGGRFNEQRIATDREDNKCEISPLVSYCGEDLGGQFPGPIQLPFYLPSLQELLQFSAASSAETRRDSWHYLDWYSDLAQKELEHELVYQLGGIMQGLEDRAEKTTGHLAEVADEVEALPPTPREHDSDGGTPRSGRGSARGSPRTGRSGSPRSGSPRSSSPRSGSPRSAGSPRSGGSPRSARSPRQPEEGAEEESVEAEDNEEQELEDEEDEEYDEDAAQSDYTIEELEGPAKDRKEKAHSPHRQGGDVFRTSAKLRQSAWGGADAGASPRSRRKGRANVKTARR